MFFRDLWPASRHLSMTFQDLWPRCWPGPRTYRRTIHLCAGCSASMSEYLIDMSVEEKGTGGLGNTSAH